MLICKGVMKLEGKRAEGCDGGGEPILGAKACCLAGSGGEELGRGLDEVYAMTRWGYAGEGVCG